MCCRPIRARPNASWGGVRKWALPSWSPCWWTRTSSGCAAGDEVGSGMRVLVTGADGFVGQCLVQRLLETGHQVTAACRPSDGLGRWVNQRWGGAVGLVPFELTDAAGIRAALADSQDAVVHLAAVASVREAREDPGRAWVVNAAGTARLLDALISVRDRGD